MTMFWLGLALALALLASLSLALSQRRNWRAVMNGAPGPNVMRARSLGATLFAVCLAVCIIRDGPGFAALLWPFLSSAAAMAVAMLLTYAPTRLQHIARALLRCVGQDGARIGAHTANS